MLSAAFIKTFFWPPLLSGSQQILIYLQTVYLYFSFSKDIIGLKPDNSL